MKDEISHLQLISALVNDILLRKLDRFQNFQDDVKAQLDQIIGEDSKSIDDAIVVRINKVM